MKKIVFAALFVLLIAGCDSLTRSVADPNSSLNTAVNTVGGIAPAVGAGATATGTPIGMLIGLITTIVATVIGVYNNHKKKIVIGGKDSELNNITTTTKAIVDAIEALSDIPVGSGETIGDVVKSKVSENLKDKEAYKIGKAIIAGLK